MYKIQIPTGVKRVELILAAVYGILITLSLGLPSTEIGPSPEPDFRALAVNEQLIDKTLWIEWKASGYGTILCPPQQSGYVVKNADGQHELVCGFLSESSAKHCAEEEQLFEHSCRPSPTIRSFYSEVGIEAPMEYRACCPKAAEGVCRFRADTLSFKAEIYC